MELGRGRGIMQQKGGEKREKRKEREYGVTGQLCASDFIFLSCQPRLLHY